MQQWVQSRPFTQLLLSGDCWALLCRGAEGEGRSAGTFLSLTCHRPFGAERSRTNRLLISTSSVSPNPEMLLVVPLGPACSTHPPPISSPKHHHTCFFLATPGHLCLLSSPLLLCGRGMGGTPFVVHRVPAMPPSLLRLHFLLNSILLCVRVSRSSWEMAQAFGLWWFLLQSLSLQPQERWQLPAALISELP